MNDTATILRLTVSVNEWLAIVVKYALEERGDDGLGRRLVLVGRSVHWRSGKTRGGGNQRIN
ncbi:MAG: hypothetical protein WD273_05695 [Trueperaceae bacterium]